MTRELLAALIAGDIALSATILYLLRTTLATERARTDRYAAALLDTAQERVASRTIAPPEPAKEPEDPQDGRNRPRQIGMSPR